MSFLNTLPGAIVQGMIWGILAIGVYITYKILDIADLTVDGSMVTGASKISTMAIAYDQKPVKKYNKANCEFFGITVPADYVEITD